VNHRGEPTVEDLSRQERLKAVLPATAALLALFALAGFFVVLYVGYQSDQDRHARERALLVVQNHNRQLFDLSTSRFQYATNRSVCGFRKLARDGIEADRTVIARSNSALADPTASSGTKKRNLKAKRDAVSAIRQAQAFLATQVTVPFDYDCSKLPPKPPPETRPPPD
jgi:hypothetical protein